MPVRRSPATILYGRPITRSTAGASGTPRVVFLKKPVLTMASASGKRLEHGRRAVGRVVLAGEEHRLDAEALARLDRAHHLDELVAARVPRHHRALSAEHRRELGRLVAHELLLGLRRPLGAERDHPEEAPVAPVAPVEIEQQRVVGDRPGHGERGAIGAGERAVEDLVRMQEPGRRELGESVGRRAERGRRARHRLRRVHAPDVDHARQRRIAGAELEDLALGRLEAAHRRRHVVGDGEGRAVHGVVARFVAERRVGLDHHAEVLELPGTDTSRRSGRPCRRRSRRSRRPRRASSRSRPRPRPCRRGDACVPGRPW